MQINVCDHRTDRSALSGKYSQACAQVVVCVCVCVCAHVHTHGCINRGAELPCVFQQSG